MTDTNGEKILTQKPRSVDLKMEQIHQMNRRQTSFNQSSESSHSGSSPGFKKSGQPSKFNSRSKNHKLLKINSTLNTLIYPTTDY